MHEQSKRLRVMAGPNGSGKSTIINNIKSRYYCGPYVNADEIQQTFDTKKVLNLSALYQLNVTPDSYDHYLTNEGASWLVKAKEDNIPIHLNFTDNNLIIDPNAEATGAYDAAIAADFIRYQLLIMNDTFTFETVLSHASKLNFLKTAKAAGYKNYLYFVCTVDPLINVNRVKQRVALGGHDVPEPKIIARYYDSLKLLSQLIPNTYRTFLIDNSAGDPGGKLIAEIKNAEEINILEDDLPWWIDEFAIRPLFE